MAKTTQALKINASVALHLGARNEVQEAIFKGPLAGAGTISKARITFNHAILARYDDPDYSARVTARIATIKAGLEKLGDLTDWYVVAGAVPVGEAEVLPDVEPAQAAAE